MTNFSSKSLKELQGLAKDAGIKGLWTMTKGELSTKLSAIEAGQTPEEQQAQLHSTSGLDLLENPERTLTVDFTQEPDIQSLFEEVVQEMGQPKISPSLTKLESLFMKAIPKDNFYENGLDSCLWTDIFLEQTCPMKISQGKGIVSSLSKKGYIEVSDPDGGRQGNPTSFTLTEVGQAWMKENMNKTEELVELTDKELALGEETDGFYEQTTGEITHYLKDLASAWKLTEKATRRKLRNSGAQRHSGVWCWTEEQFKKLTSK